MSVLCGLHNQYESTHTSKHTARLIDYCAVFVYIAALLCVFVYNIIAAARFTCWIQSLTLFGYVIDE